MESMESLIQQFGADHHAVKVEMKLEFPQSGVAPLG